MQVEEGSVINRIDFCCAAAAAFDLYFESLYAYLRNSQQINVSSTPLMPNWHGKLLTFLALLIGHSSYNINKLFDWKRQ